MMDVLIAIFMVAVTLWVMLVTVTSLTLWIFNYAGAI